jgi:cytochrome c5
MKSTNLVKVLFAVLLCTLLLSSLLAASSSAGSSSGGSPSTHDGSAAAALVHVADADNMRVAGEQRFHANCGRCHAAPQKFPPRMMATILRHMRVRATITEQDRRLILFYMTQ